MKEMCMLGNKGFRCFGIFLWIYSLSDFFLISLLRGLPSLHGKNDFFVGKKRKKRLAQLN